MIRDSQYKLPHIYANAAGLKEPTYRNILRSSTGCSSIKDPRFNQAKFERAMAALETTLFLRVAAGQAENPIGRNRWIRNEFYWRSRLPSDGRVSSRQMHRIKILWDRLLEFLPEGKGHTGYLLAIIHRATGKYQTDYASLTPQQADSLIDALTDRLHYAEAELRATQEGDFVTEYLNTPFKYG